VDVPVSADLENCFADDPAGVAETVRLAVEAGLAGCSVEDFSGRESQTIYDAGLAAERVGAAAEAAHSGPRRLVVTARAENHVHDIDDLADTIARLQSFQEAGADVLFAPGVRDPDDIRRLVSSVDLPVNVLVLPGMPTVDELADAGASRISVGGAFAFAAYGAAAAAGRELLESGTYGSWETAGRGAKAVREAFEP
jgi:2-methylisocitrate lyase-like PEP mutase family enzyme